MKTLRGVAHVFIFIAVMVAAVAIVMLLWNALIPSIIGWSAINYWQAGGLFILAHILFGGPMRHAGFFMSNPNIHSRFHERMRGMTRDQKREFIRRRMAEYSPFEDQKTAPTSEDKIDE